MKHFAIIYFVSLSIIILLWSMRKKSKEEEKELNETKEIFCEKEEKMEKVIEINCEDITEDKLLKEILKLKRKKTSSYRNYPNQSALRYIYRRKPKYLNNYVFSDYNFENEKMMVENSKYSMKEEYEARFFNKMPLPLSYLKDEIVLIPKNTNTLFAYWEIREETYDNLLKQYEITSENPIIILKNVYHEEKFRINTYTRNGSMYINNVDCDNDYIVYIGYVDFFGNFIEIAHSKEANVPNDSPSNNTSVTWGIADVLNYENHTEIDFREIHPDEFENYIEYLKELKDDEFALGDSKAVFDYASSSYNGSSMFLGSSFKGSSDNVVK